MLRFFKKTQKERTIPTPFRAHIETANSVELAFEYLGIKYYRWANEYNLPYERMSAALMVMKEFELKCDLSFLRAAISEAKKQIEGDGKKIRIMEAYKHLDAIDERMSWQFDPDIVYRLAAVVFFDETENPYAYEHAHAMAKCERWRTADKEAEQLRFFLQKLGLHDYAAHWQDAGHDLATYLVAIRKRKATHHRDLLQSSYASGRTPEPSSFSVQEKANLDRLTASESGATTTTSSS